MSNFTKTCPQEAELFHADTQTNGRTGMTKLRVFFAILPTRLKIPQSSATPWTPQSSHTYPPHSHILPRIWHVQNVLSVSDIEKCFSPLKDSDRLNVVWRNYEVLTSIILLPCWWRSLIQHRRNWNFGHCPWFKTTIAIAFWRMDLSPSQMEKTDTDTFSWKFVFF
jgi:hypothetical protein